MYVFIIIVNSVDYLFVFIKNNLRVYLLRFVIFRYVVVTYSYVRFVRVSDYSLGHV